MAVSAFQTSTAPTGVALLRIGRKRLNLREMIWVGTQQRYQLNAFPYQIVAAGAVIPFVVAINWSIVLASI